MPRAPEVRTSLPSEGSVGRLRINAPVEAFGGGAAAQGLADVGRGLQSVGQGVQDIQAARERKQQEELKRQQELAKAQAARQKKLNELRNDRLLLTYNQKAIDLQGKVKSTQTSGTGITKQEIYLRESSKLRNEILKDADLLPYEKEEMLIKMEEKDLSRVKTLIESQASEDEQYRQDTRKAQKGNIITSMRDSHADLTKDNVLDWFQNQNPSSNEYAQGLLSDGVPRESAGDEVNATRAQGFKEAIREKMAGLSNSTTPTGDGENIAAILDQVPPSIMDREEKDEFKGLIERKAKARVKELEDQAIKARNEQLDVFASDLENMDNDWDKEQELADFTANNPDLQAEATTIFNARTKRMTLAEKVELTEELQATKDPEAFQNSLMGRLKKGEISIGAYNEYKAKSQKSMDRRKKSSWNRIIARQKDILEGRVDIGAGTGEIRASRGMFNKDIKLKQEMLDAWDNLEELAFDPNVTWRELEEVADNVFFKPEAKMLSMDMEERMEWARATLLERAVEPGTQTGESDIDPYTRANRASDDEILEKLFPGLTTDNKRIVDGVIVEATDVFPSNRDEADADVIKSVAEQIRSTIE